MSTGLFELGDYTLEDDPNSGDLVIKDPGGTTILTWDDTNNKWVMSASAPLDLAELIDGSGVSHTGELQDVGDAPASHAASHEAGGSDTITIGNLLNFDPVEVLIDTNANRPAAGTVDRVFIEQDTGKILRDNGTSYDVVGTTNIADTDHVAADHENGGSLEISVQGLSGDLADAQDPKTHAPSHKDGGADELDAAELAGGLGSSGQFLQSDGAASSWVANPNEPDWVEDANSPFTATSVTSDQFVLNGTYDVVKVFIDVEDVSSATNNIDLRANGDSGANYAFVDEGGTETSGASQVSNLMVLGADEASTYSFTVAGRFTGRWRGGAVGFDGAASRVSSWRNTNITSPLDSLTLLGSGNFDITWNVYGRDIGPAGEP